MNLHNRILRRISPGKIREQFRYNRVRRCEDKLELRVIGLKRTGNHAIINWIISQYPGEVMFYNNLSPLDPPIHAARKEYRDNRHLGLAKGQQHLQPLFIYSYEDHPLYDLCSDKFQERHPGYVGQSGKRFDILILRDPFNLFASRFLWKRPRGARFREDEEYRWRIVNLWRSYAKEVVGMTEYLKEDKLVISYNQWVAFHEYRRKLAETLGLVFSDQGIDEVPDYGSGSSINMTDMAQNARKMNVMERWKTVAEEPTYKGIFLDSEIWELSEKIFGVIPETDQLLRSSSQISPSPKL